MIRGRAGIVIFSPLLDARGNSVRGIKVCEEPSERFGLYAFELGFAGEQLANRFQRKKAIARYRAAIENRRARGGRRCASDFDRPTWSDSDSAAGQSPSVAHSSCS